MHTFEAPGWEAARPADGPSTSQRPSAEVEHVARHPDRHGGAPTSGSPGERLDQPTYVTRKRLNVAGPTGFLVRCDGSLPGLNRLRLALVHQLGGGLRRNDERIRLRKLEQL